MSVHACVRACACMHTQASLRACMRACSELPAHWRSAGIDIACALPNHTGPTHVGWTPMAHGAQRVAHSACARWWCLPSSSCAASRCVCALGCTINCAAHNSSPTSTAAGWRGGLQKRGALGTRPRFRYPSLRAGVAGAVEGCAHVRLPVCHRRPAGPVQPRASE